MSNLYFLSSGVQMEEGYSLIHNEIPLQKDTRLLIINGTRPDQNDRIREAFYSLGISYKNISLFNGVIKKNYYDYIYVVEGNTFQLMDYLQKNNLISYIRESVISGSNYIGISAGGHVAGISIISAEPYDENKIDLKDYTGMCLFSGFLIPHYSKNRYDFLKRLRFTTGENVYTIAQNELLVICVDDFLQTILIQTFSL